MSRPSRYRKPLLVTLAFHGVLLLLLIVSITATQFRAPPSAAQMTTIKATTVTQAQLETAAKITKPEKEKVVQAQEAVLKKRQAQAQAEAIAREHAKAKQQTKVLAEAKAKQQAKASAEAKASAQARAKARAQAEAQARQTTLKQLQTKLLQQQIASEQKNISQVLSTAQTGVIDQYKAQILSVIQSNWRIDKVDDTLKCIYSVTLAPDGTVVAENLVRSSGDDNLDQSARQAIQVSSPLPVPSDPVLFDHFRHLLLTLSPQGYLQAIEQ